jgi:hypothetical protein
VPARRHTFVLLSRSPMPVSSFIPDAGPSDGIANPASHKEQSDMSYPYMPMALARERQDTLLAEAEAVRLARQARVHRRSHGTPGSRRSPLRVQGWLLAWSRLLTRRGWLAAGERSG